MKNFINSDETKIDGSHGLGSIVTTYQKLVDTFGKETFDWSGDLKSECYWTLLFNDGTIATIYDWKSNKRYCGDIKGISKDDNINWNIGGFSSKAVELVQRELDKL